MSYIIDWLTAAFSSPRSSIAQIIGFVPLGMALFIFKYNSRKKTLILKMTADGLWAVHFFILGQFTGGAINVVNIVRGYVFLNRNKKWASKIYIPIIFCVLILLTAITDFQGPKNFLAVFGSILAVIGFWQNDIKKLRIYNFLGISLWLIYGILTVSVPVVISNAFSIISIISSFKKKK